MKAGHATLQDLKIKCSSSDTAGSVTIEEIKLAIACTQPPHARTAVLFCEAMSSLAYNGKSPACDKIASAGGIAVIVQLLACFVDEKDVVYSACLALGRLAERGSAAVRSDIRSQPDMLTLLRSASARLQAWSKTDSATNALNYVDPVLVSNSTHSESYRHVQVATVTFLM